MDEVFKALAHADRRRMLDLIKAAPGCSVAHVASQFSMSRIGTMKHLKILERANLIISNKVGRVRKLYHNVVPIQMIYDRWTTEYTAYWAREVTKVKRNVESRARTSRRAS